MLDLNILELLALPLFRFSLLPTACLPACLPFYLPACLPFCHSTCLSTCLSAFLHVCLSSCLFSLYYPCVSYIDDFFLSILNTSSISSGCITPLSSLHYQSLLGALSLLSKNPDIIHLCVLYNIKSFYKTKNECSANHSSAFLVDSLWIQTFQTSSSICWLWSLLSFV